MNVKKYFTLVLSTLLICLVISAGILAARFAISPFAQGDHGAALEPIVPNSKVNILVMGTDANGVNTDTIMVVCIDPEKKRANVLSIPRDTRVKIGNSYHKINYAYPYAAATKRKKEEFVIGHIKDVTGLQIHFYAVINFQGFRNIIDKLGGVRFDVPINMDYDDPAQDLHIHVKKGDQLLNGKNAEGVVRFRKDNFGGGYPDGDYGRIKTQQEFLHAVAEQKLKFEYIAKIPEIYSQVSKNVKSNLQLDDLINYGKLLASIPKENIKTFLLPGEPKYINNISYHLPDAAKMAELLDTDFGYNLPPQDDEAAAQAAE